MHARSRASREVTAHCRVVHFAVARRALTVIMASGVFLHVGQCGVQLGRSFWDTMLELAQATAGTTRKSQLIKNSSSTSTMPLAVCEDVLLCVVVDSEPRPAHSCFGHRVSPHKLFPDVLVTDKPGRGNNWAFGYNGRTPKSKGCDRELVEKVRDAVRRMAEECSCFLGVIIFHSIAGGTGSGEHHNNNIHKRNYLLSGSRLL